MRVFDHPNFTGGFRCRICKTSADQPVVLVPVPGTERDGIMEARQIHAECYALMQKMLEAEESHNNG
jgi:hypothetical protein